MIYVENREAVKLNDIILGKSNSHIRDVFYTKSKDWGYEKEHRKCGFFNFAKRKLENNDSLGYLIFLFGIPKDAITGIILGRKIKQNDEDEIRQIIKRDNYNIYTKQAIISTSDYKIIIR